MYEVVLNFRVFVLFEVVLKAVYQMFIFVSLLLYKICVKMLAIMYIHYCSNWLWNTTWMWFLKIEQEAPHTLSHTSPLLQWKLSFQSKWNKFIWNTNFSDGYLVTRLFFFHCQLWSITILVLESFSFKHWSFGMNSPFVDCPWLTFWFKSGHLMYNRSLS
jgi:hypothetical protein